MDGWLCAILWCVCLALVFSRGFVRDREFFSWESAYEAATHLFVGGLIGALLATGGMQYLGMVLVLSAIEIAAFVLKRTP